MKNCQKYGESYGTKANKAVYNGPFKVDQWKPEDKIMLSKMINIGIEIRLN